jgi:hypothetical protein
VGQACCKLSELGARVQKISRGCFADRVGGVWPFSLAAFSLPSTADAEPPRVTPYRPNISTPMFILRRQKGSL